MFCHTQIWPYLLVILRIFFVSVASNQPMRMFFAGLAMLSSLLSSNLLESTLLLKWNREFLFVVVLEVSCAQYFGGFNRMIGKQLAIYDPHLQEWSAIPPCLSNLSNGPNSPIKTMIHVSTCSYSFLFLPLYPLIDSLNLVLLKRRRGIRSSLLWWLVLLLGRLSWYFFTMRGDQNNHMQVYWSTVSDYSFGLGSHTMIYENCVNPFLFSSCYELTSPPQPTLLCS
jgi:hypothetical protein